MDSLLQHLRFPLLMKELTEQANRRRTYIVRFLYAFVLFGLGLLAIAGGESGGDIRLGAGRDIFHDLVRMQFWLVLIFLPATASGALTIEKEHDSLALLLLTTIPPWSIVLQKFLSRLIPMVSFLLLAFPLMAAAYSYGGVATGELIGAIGLLLLFAAEVASVAVMCSAYCRTTGEAFIATYALLALLAAFGIWPQLHFSLLTETTVPNAVEETWTGAFLTMLVSLVCLVVASRFVESRAFVPPRNLLLQMFQKLDRFYNDLNKVTGGVVLFDDRNQLPGDDPIAWRETSKKSLGTARYLFRVFTALEVPILFVAAAVNIDMVRGSSSVTGLLYILWVIAAALLCVHASGVVTAERSRQTLDSLLTAPLTGAEIVKQKMAGVRRLIGVLLVPFGSIYVFQLWFRGFDIGYAVGSFGTAFIFLWLVTWGALWIGLHLHGTMKAVLTSMFAVLAVCAVPMIAETVLSRWTPMARIGVPAWIGSMSPANIIRGIEGRGTLHNPVGELQFWVLLGMLPVYGLALMWVRGTCLRHADRLLNRVPDDVDAPIDPVSADSSDTADRDERSAADGTHAAATSEIAETAN